MRRGIVIGYRQIGDEAAGQSTEYNRGLYDGRIEGRREGLFFGGLIGFFAGAVLTAGALLSPSLLRCSPARDSNSGAQVEPNRASENGSPLIIEEGSGER